jgi:hypothetical protein
LSKNMKEEEMEKNGDHEIENDEMLIGSLVK